MRLAVLFSAGKDSALAALLAARDFDVVLVTCHFGVTDAHEHAVPAADALGLPLETLELDEGVAADAVDRLVADGYPRNALQAVHEHALETVAARPGVDAVADGTRRDDRTPTVDRATARSLEDRRGVAYVAPLAGFGRDAVDHLAARHLVVETGPSETVGRADYEAELRALLADRGDTAIAEVFPDHTQSRVVDRRGGG